MYLKSKEIAFTGLLMALGVVLLLLGGVISTTTLFFLAAAAFLAGVMERNYSLGLGIFYLAGTALLGFMLSPRKLHALTFSAMAVYVLLAEWFEKRRYAANKPINPLLQWGIKFAVFHMFFVAALFMADGLFGIGNILGDGLLGKLGATSRLVSGILLVAGAEVFWLVYDRAYLFFQRTYGHFFCIRE